MAAPTAETIQLDTPDGPMTTLRAMPAGDPIGGVVVIQEAFAHRRPVICADIGGMAEKVRPGLDGFHFPAGPQGFANSQVAPRPPWRGAIQYLRSSELKSRGPRRIGSTRGDGKRNGARTWRHCPGPAREGLSLRAGSSRAAPPIPGDRGGTGKLSPPRSPQRS